jgi:hypothetical protein
MATILNLDKWKSLFKDDQAYKQFTGLLEEAAEDTSVRLLVSDDRVLLGLVSPEEAQNRLRDRIMQRLAEKPEILDRLKERLESDNLVD